MDLKKEPININMLTRKNCVAGLYGMSNDQLVFVLMSLNLLSSFDITRGTLRNYHKTTSRNREELLNFLKTEIYTASQYRLEGIHLIVMKQELLPSLTEEIKNPDLILKNHLNWLELEEKNSEWDSSLQQIIMDAIGLVLSRILKSEFHSTDDSCWERPALIYEFVSNVFGYSVYTGVSFFENEIDVESFMACIDLCISDIIQKAYNKVKLLNNIYNRVVDYAKIRSRPITRNFNSEIFEPEIILDNEFSLFPELIDGSCEFEDLF